LAIEKYEITCVIHLAALLSFIAECKPVLAHQVNVYSIYPLLELAKEKNVKVFIPSTIGAFGPESPRAPTPDICIQRPKSIYGISKVYTELIGEYFFLKHGVDFRCLRYPGIISSDSEPGGGTTDYAVDIFQEAVKNRKYTCYLRGDTLLPMMHIDDCVKSTIDFVDVERKKLKQTTYNVGAVSFTPNMLAEEIKKTIPQFTIDYNVDPIRQNIADSWPQVFEDSNARHDWGHDPKMNTSQIVEQMLE
ncbi:L-threonine 3-dehydrogenase, mitochondrial-like, partial [Pempheris klunzingeri]|uniref:L-threonine 3-dehydrogenase, mitochondrial-like n=1 Tax=Pempheris klunzingeri TaxID=3127111 RepID=UPI00397EDE8C